MIVASVMTSAPPRQGVYPYNRAFLASPPAEWREFLAAHSYHFRGKRRYSGGLIVSVPVVQRTELERFCRAAGICVTAIYDLPRADPARNRVGICLHNRAEQADFFKLPLEQVFGYNCRNVDN